MLCDILRDKGIESFAAVHILKCKAGNERLYSALPEDCYVIFCLFPYLTKERNSRLAAFTAAPDYHIFARKLFSETAEYISEKYKSRYVRGFSDHSPLEERHGAACAGLGIIGRHGLLISEKYSSFICIGELICNLTEDELISEGIEIRCEEIRYCEDCGKCVSACPAGCIGGDKTNCLSAITQKKGELTESEIKAVRDGGSIWGCDRCQLACPHTMRAMRDETIYTKIRFFQENVLTGDETEVENLTDEQYKKYTFSYRKRNVMQRNINIIKEGSR